MDEKDFIEFAMDIGKLKRTPRTGWKFHGVKRYESVADHIFRVISLAMILSDELKLDTKKIMKMAIIHDWEESIIGDMRTPDKDKIGDIVSERCLEAFKKVTERLPENIRKEYLELWKEVEYKTSDEAKFVKNVDLIELMIQCLEYEKEQPDVDLSEFWMRVEPKVTEPFLKNIFNVLKSMRLKK